ncbi:MAG: hypothetical protein R2911_41620 [Caldilineaceae bacterium]
MPPLRPFRMGQMFSEVTHGMGLHPHPVAVGVNSVAYDGRPAINIRRGPTALAILTAPNGRRTGCCPRRWPPATWICAPVAGCCAC